MITPFKKKDFVIYLREREKERAHEQGEGPEGEADLPLNREPIVGL